MHALRPYQTAAVAAVREAAAKGQRRSLLAMATGTGKTATATAIVSETPGRALFIAPFDEIVMQTARAFKRDLPRRYIGICKGGRNEHRADVVVASLQTISRKQRLAQFAKGDFELIVIDECHLQVDAYTRVLEHLATEQTQIVGLSATPYRLDNKPLDAVGEIVFEYNIAEAIEAGYLCDIEAYEFTLPSCDLSGVKTKGGELDASQLETVMTASNYDEHIIKQWRRYASDRKTVVFLPKVEMARTLARTMRDAGIAAEAIDGSLPKEQRQAILSRYASGQTQVLTCVVVLATGWDSPKTDCLILARPTKSRALKLQMLGRALRLAEGKNNALILDMVSATRGDLFSVARLAGVKRLNLGERFTAARARSAREAAEDAARAAADAKRVEDELRAERVRLLERERERQAFFERAAAPANPFRWQLQLDGTELLSVRTGKEFWQFRLRPLPGGARQLVELLPAPGVAERWRIIAATPDAAKAQAETKAQALIDACIPKASEPQLKLLVKLRVPVPRGCTRAEASRLIGQALNEKKQPQAAARAAR